MKCPLCDVEMRMIKTRNIVEIIEEVPHLYREMDISCVNDKCPNYEKVVETIREEQPIG